MEIRKRTAWFAAIAVTAAMAAAGQAAAMASPGTTTLSILAQSNFAPVSGHVYVGYHGGSFAQAQISGTVTGGVTGQDVVLYAQTFPFKKAAAPVGTPVTLTASDTYQFTVTPSVATRYTAELFATPTSTSPLAQSSAVTVYAIHWYIIKGGSCRRPVCHPTFRVDEKVARSALRTEIAKKIYVYAGLRFSRTGVPLPKEVVLGADGARVSRPHRVNSHEYEYTVSFSFSVGDRGFNFLFETCQKDTESKDGFNLPGHHSCGKRVLTLKKLRGYIGHANGGPAGIAAQVRAAQ
jgi:hypothetical protein